MKPYLAKIFVLVSLVLIVCGLAKVVLAAGEGYFLEKGKEFFIFDNLYINGYLAIGQNIINKEGRPGDVLIDKELSLDKDSSFIFCQDQKNNAKQAINRDCSAKVMVWYPDPDKGLNVLDANLYQVQTNKIEVTNGVTFNAVSAINNSSHLIISNGCLANNGDTSCNPNELVSNKVMVKTGLGLLNDKSISGYGDKTITLKAGTKILLGDIDLGNIDNRHNICMVRESRCIGSDCAQLGTVYPGTLPVVWKLSTGGSDNNNKIMICDLQVNF